MCTFMILLSILVILYVEGTLDGIVMDGYWRINPPPYYIDLDLIHKASK